MTTDTGAITRHQLDGIARIDGEVPLAKDMPTFSSQRDLRTACGSQKGLNP